MYKLTQDGGILRADGASIPIDELNTDYAEYRIWLAAGNVPETAAPDLAELQTATLAKARAMRLPVLSILDGLQASALVTAATVPVGDPPVATPLAQVIEDLKQGLRDLPNTVDLSACTTREEMEEVVLTAYYTLASSAPAQVQSAFNSLVV